jgi:hypothetical protein
LVICGGCSLASALAIFATVAFDPLPAWSLANAANESTSTTAQRTEPSLSSEDTTATSLSACARRNFRCGRRGWTAGIVRRVSIEIDPLLLMADGEAYARLLPESAQGGAATVTGALTVVTFWLGAAAFWFDHPITAPLRRQLGYGSGREFMLRFPLPDRGRRRRRDPREDVLALAVFASYPLWWWLGWDHGRRRRPRGA